MAGEPVKTVTVPLDINGLRIYKKQNPEKFYHKFGDIDLDNLPEGFNINVQRAKTLASHTRTPLMDFSAQPKTPEEIAEEIARLTAMLPAQSAPVVVSREEVVEALVEDAVKEIEENAEKVPEDAVGGNTLQGNEIK